MTVDEQRTAFRLLAWFSTSAPCDAHRGPFLLCACGWARDAHTLTFDAA